MTGRFSGAWNPGKGVTATPGVYGPDALVLSNLGYLYALHVNGARGAVNRQRSGWWRR